MYLEIYTLCSTGRCFEKWFQYQDFWQALFIFVHETEVGTKCDHITLNFECDNGSSLQIFVQQEVQNAYHYFKLNFKLQDVTPFKFFFCMKVRLQPHVKKV